MQRQKMRRKRRLITLSVRLLAAFIMSVMLVGIAVVVLLTGGRESYFIYAEENPSEKSAKDGADENEPAMIIIPDEPAKQEIQASTSENTVSGDDPAVEPMVRIAITEPDGWYSKAVKIKVIAEDIASTGNFTIKTVKARIGQNGSWTDITDTMSVEMSENGTFYVEVTDTKGNIYSKNARIVCFDFTKPTLNAAVNNGTLTVQASDTDSGIKAVYVNGFEFTNLTNGTVNIRMEQFDTGYQYFTVQAMDNAGNMSENYRVNNPYYSTGSSSSGSKAVLPESASATKPASATATVTDHIKTDSQGNMISANKAAASVTSSKTEEKKKSLTEADAQERSEEYATVSGQGREFYTIEAKTGKVFYLIIDRNGEDEEVHFVTDITENDLLNVTEETSETLPKNAATLEAGAGIMDSGLLNNNNLSSEKDEEGGFTAFFGKKEKEEETVSEDEVSLNEIEEKREDQAEPEKKGGQTALYIICFVVALIVIVIAYVLKKIKQNRDGDFDENEDEDPDERDLPDDDAGDEDGEDRFYDEPPSEDRDENEAERPKAQETKDKETGQS